MTVGEFKKFLADNNFSDEREIVIATENKIGIKPLEVIEPEKVEKAE